MSDARVELAFALLNASVVPWWAVFLAAPRSRLAGRLASHGAVFAVAGALYGVLLVAALATGDAAAGPLQSAFWRGALATPLGFLAGWTHYLCFDLFVGAWIVREAGRLGLAPRVALFFTWLAGPLGLGLFLARRWQRLRTLGELGAHDLA